MGTGFQRQLSFPGRSQGTLAGKRLPLHSEEKLLCFTACLLLGPRAFWGDLVLSVPPSPEMPCSLSLAHWGHPPGMCLETLERQKTEAEDRVQWGFWVSRSNGQHIHGQRLLWRP